MGKALINYYRNNMETVEMGLRESEEGRDLLFHSAPSVIVIHSSMEGSTPVEDAQFAAYNIALLAESLALGTCFIGYAVEAINRASNVKKYLGIPARNRAHAVITVGYPDIKFYKPALRKKIRVRTFE
jgi:nitroreductase